MSIKNSDLGGTDWTTGTVLNHTDLNDTFDATVIHRKVHSYATEIYSESTNYVTVSSFTVTGNGSMLLMGLNFKCELRGQNGATAYARVKISGATLGNYYTTQTYLSRLMGYSDTYSISVSTIDTNCINTNDNAFGQLSFNCSPLLVLPNETITFTIQMKTSSGEQKATIKNTTTEILYVSSAKDD